MGTMDKITGGLLTLAMASSLSASDFETKTKSALPEISMNKLKKDMKMMAQVKTLTIEQAATFNNELEVMAKVNEHTKNIFLPALEANLQRWMKEDVESVKHSLTWIQIAITTRTKQYDVLQKLFKKAKAPSSLLSKLDLLTESSLENKVIVRNIKMKVEVLKEAKTLFSRNKNVLADIELDDYWLPVVSLESENSMIVTNNTIQTCKDFEWLDDVEQRLQSALSEELLKTKHITSIVVG